MNCIKLLTDIDFNLDVSELINPKKRIAARGLVFNSEGKIAILNKKNKNEYKLIGGGVEEDEDPKIAFEREVLEEAGCRIEIDDFIGIIEEKRTKCNFYQVSYVYKAHVIEDTKQLSLTAKEISEGSELKWLNIDEAIELIKNCEDILVDSIYDDVYNTKFVVRRDYYILQYYIDVYSKH